MDECCNDAACEIETLGERQRSTLTVVLARNGSMFAIEVVAGLLAASTALRSDSLDMLGDALVYGFSVSVVSRDGVWQALSALIKGGIMALLGLLVLSHAIYKFVTLGTPQFDTIGLIGRLA